MTWRVRLASLDLCFEFCLLCRNLLLSHFASARKTITLDFDLRESYRVRLYVLFELCNIVTVCVAARSEESIRGATCTIARVTFIIR